LRAVGILVQLRTVCVHYRKIAKLTRPRMRKTRLEWLQNSLLSKQTSHDAAMINNARAPHALALLQALLDKLDQQL
jgi:hypothetical protein